MWEGQDHLSDLDFADDIALIADSWYATDHYSSNNRSRQGWPVHQKATNPEKCKILTTTVWNDRTDMRYPGYRLRHRES